MLSLDMDSDVSGRGDTHNLFRDLPAELLLDLKPVRELLGDARKLGKPKHRASRDVSDRHIAPEWQQVVFADAIHTHSRHANKISTRKKTGLCLTWPVIDKLTPPVSEATGRLLESFSCRIFADRLYQFTSDMHQSIVIRPLLQF